MRKARYSTLVVAALSIASCALLPYSGGDTHGISKLLSDRREAGAVRLTERIDAIKKEYGFPDIYRVDHEAVSKVESGEYRTASAAWWGWSPIDSTAMLNAALSAPVDTLIIPKMEGPWLVGPLFVAGPKTILLEPGCEIIAANGEFLGKGDCLLTIKTISDVRISGYGSRLAMRKGDYRNPPYSPSQWRHAVAILESENILIEGLSIERSGGDGVYVGQKSGGRVPTNIVLRDLRVSQNLRQGVSVIAADTFRLEYSEISGTSGHQPQAGIDFEPNRNVYGLVDCRIASCLFIKNAGSSIHIHLSNLGPKHPPTDITVIDSTILGNPVAIWAQGMDNGVHGNIVFRGNKISGLRLIKRSTEMSIGFH